MPKRKRTYGKRKRTFKRRRGRKRRTMVSTVSLGISPYPAQYKVKLRYATQVSINPSAGTGTAALFSANGIYDCEVAVGGHQPRGHDEMFNAYDHVRVLGSKITCLFANNTNDPNLVGVYLTDTTTTVTNHIDLMERPRTIFRVMGDGTSGPNTMKLSKSFSARGFFGKAARTDDVYRGDVNNNPTEQAYFGVYVGPTDSAADVGQVVQVIIDYICIFTEPKQLSQS